MKMNTYSDGNSSPESHFHPFLGERLRRAREYLGYTRQDSAQHIGVDQSMVYDFERGSRKVSDDTLKKFSDLYQRSVDWLTLEQRPTESMHTGSMAPLPKGFESKDWDEIQTFKQVLGAFSRNSKESHDVERLVTFIGAGKCHEKLHQELNTYQWSHDNGYVDIFYAISRLDITLILRPISILGSVFRLNRRTGLILSVNRPTTELRFASASALVRLIGIHQRSRKKSDKFWYSLASEQDLSKFERDNLKASLDLLLPTYLLAALQTRQKWTNADLANPVIMYQASLRLETSYKATVRAFLRSQYISVSEARKLLRENFCEKT